MAIPKEKLPKIVERIRNGASLGEEARALGMSYRTTLISALRAFLGVEPYKAMMSTRQPTARNGALLSSIERQRPDDKKLPVVKSMTRSDGWRWRHAKEHEPRARSVKLPDGTATIMDTGARILIMIDNAGKEYVAAFDHEKADLLRVHPIRPDGPPLRFVEFKKSEWRKRIEKNTDHGTEELKRGAAALQRKREKANGTTKLPTLLEVAKKVQKVKATAKKAKAAPKKAAPKKSPKARRSTSTTRSK